MNVPTEPPYYEKILLKTYSICYKPIFEMNIITGYELYYHALGLDYEE